MSRYTIEWPCCGDTSITNGYEPGECPFCSCAGVVQAAIKLEREACAKVCERLHKRQMDYFAGMGSAGMPEYDAKDCANAIRARSEDREGS